MPGPVRTNLSRPATVQSGEAWRVPRTTAMILGAIRFELVINGSIQRETIDACAAVRGDGATASRRTACARARPFFLEPPTMPMRALRYAASPLLRVRDGFWAAKNPPHPEQAPSASLGTGCAPYRGLIPSRPGAPYRGTPRRRGSTQVGSSAPPARSRPHRRDESCATREDRQALRAVRFRLSGPLANVRTVSDAPIGTSLRGATEILSLADLLRGAGRCGRTLPRRPRWTRSRLRARPRSGALRRVSVRGRHRPIARLMRLGSAPPSMIPDSISSAIAQTPPILLV